MITSGMHKSRWIFGKVRVIATKANYFECINTEYVNICKNSSLSGSVSAYHAILVLMYTMIQARSRAHCRLVYMYTRIQGRAYTYGGIPGRLMGRGYPPQHSKNEKSLLREEVVYCTHVGGWICNGALQAATLRCRRQNAESPVITGGLAIPEEEKKQRCNRNNGKIPILFINCVSL